ncbi:YdeI/OmpD-associated family protein [Herbiconiux sp. CPCC 205763]|uniref:YdeI/OmpD-associated family protein n=1 Tax=Herbiconiux aconitum TaxID=2970913 RepID=A0ABT2GNS9_9MICO|nr:YdeI/OmpD-associated family protein [Herbiconiux aconitum]MCS5717882.1 YdeI/OmpD-associated family protein [Herbiconiux aconitum]
MAEKARTGSARTRFTTEVLLVGERLIARFPEVASAELPSRGQVAVTGLINEHPFEAVVEPDGLRGHWLDVGEVLRGIDDDADTGSGAGSVGEGDTVELEIERNEAWPEPNVPAEFDEALAETPAAGETWEGITPMARWEWVRWVNATKNPATREKRIEVSMSKLGKGMRRPCCFDLSSCTDPELSKNGKLLGLS